MHAKTRIADVARAAGVSTATVSRALSDPAKVGIATRAKVLAAINATGYRVNGAARDLRQQRARSILVLAPNLANTFFSRIVAAIQEVAGAAGLAVQVSDTRVRQETLLALGHDGRADGLIVLDGSLPPSMVRAWRVPTVQLCELNSAYGVPGLGIDNAAAAGLAVDHLADLGHRAVLHIAGPPQNVLSGARKAGFRSAAKRRGLNHVVLEGDFTLESGTRAARDWAAMADRPAAVFAASDECAFGFISECNRMGLSVPNDVSVIGFDDIDFAGHFTPPLTTIHQPRASLGRLAAERLVAALQQDEPMPLEQELVEAHLVVRGSTAPCGA